MKTTYTKFLPRFLLGWYYKETPAHWIILVPIKIFGIFLGYKMKCATKGYVWADGKVEV